MERYKVIIDLEHQIDKDGEPQVSYKFTFNNISKPGEEIDFARVGTWAAAALQSLAGRVECEGGEH